MAAQAFIYGGVAALELAGGYFASQNIKATAKLNKDIADMNAEFAELDAYDSELEGQSAVGRYQEVIDRTLSEQQAAMTAADIDVNYGSAAAVKEETQFIGELNKMQIQKDAQNQALGFRRQARDTRLQANLGYAGEKARAAAVQFSSVTGAVKTGLTGYERSR